MNDVELKNKQGTYKLEGWGDEAKGQNVRLYYS